MVTFCTLDKIAGNLWAREPDRSAEGEIFVSKFVSQEEERREKKKEKISIYFLPLSVKRIE